jgi:hypothetical protein
VITTVESNGSAYLGEVTSVTQDGDSLDFTAAYVEPSTDQTLEILYELSSNGAYSSYRAASAVAPSVGVFLDPPLLPSPSPLYGTLDFGGFDGPADAKTWVDILGDDETTVWHLYNEGAPGAALRMPKLPSAIDPRVILGTGSVVAVPEVCDAQPDGYCLSWSRGTPAELVAP